ncbi:hypothetical protein GCM10028818_52420 [Spirosoma horti]
MDETYASSLDGLTQLIHEGYFKAVVNQVYPLQAVGQAHRQSQTKTVRGERVREITNED